ADARDRVPRRRAAAPGGTVQRSGRRESVGRDRRPAGTSGSRRSGSGAGSTVRLLRLTIDSATDRRVCCGFLGYALAGTLRGEPWRLRLHVSQSTMSDAAATVEEVARTTPTTRAEAKSRSD